MIIRHDGERLWATKDQGEGNIRDDFKVLSQNNCETRVPQQKQGTLKGNWFCGGDDELS